MGVDVLANLAAFALQTCAIVMAAALLLRVLRVSSPGIRYSCWRLILVACLLMPWLLRQPAEQAVAGDVGTSEQVATLDGVAAEWMASLPQTSDETLPRVPWQRLAAAAFLAGVLARGCWLLAGLVRLRAFRSQGTPIDDPEYEEMQRVLGTTATLRSVPGLTQPATFGLRHPIVLLPEALKDSPASLRRAVVTHELFHVQRRDWMWVLSEEIVRTALWFHPAILWVTSRIQLSREELVDELTVLATGDRKAYIEALLAFADAGRVRPAPAFARRRQLFTRIVRLSKEGVMSAPRVIVSAGLVIAAVLGSGWYASRAFPILSAATSPGTGISTAQRPRTADVVQPPTTVAVPVTAQGARSGGAPRPGPAAVAAPRTVTKAITPENPIPRRLSSVPAQYPAQLRGSGYRGRVTLQVTLEASGSIGEVLRNGSEVGGGDSSDADAARRATDAFYQAATDAVRQWRYQPPADPPIAFFVTVRFDDERDATGVQSDSPTGVAGARTFAPVGTAAFAINRDSLLQLEARMLALRAERDRRAAQFGGQDPQMLELSKQLSNMERELERARELQKRADAAPNTVEVGSPSNRFVTGPGQASGVPVRIGGNIRPPAKTRMVNPEYPAIAQSARVQGVVIVEVVIDEHGRVAEARILRSIPLLDQAALDAVRQWEYAPTLLNGSAVPVVMTVTVQFTLPEQAF